MVLKGTVIKVHTLAKLVTILLGITSRVNRSAVFQLYHLDCVYSVSLKQEPWSVVQDYNHPSALTDPQTILGLPLEL